MIIIKRKRKFVVFEGLNFLDKLLIKFNFSEKINTRKIISCHPTEKNAEIWVIRRKKAAVKA